MKTKTLPTAPHPSEAEIRDYAHHLYIQSGWLPGRDLDNWLEAEAHLMASAAERTHAQPAHPRGHVRVYAHAPRPKPPPPA